MDPFRNGAAGVAQSASPIGRSLNRSSAKLFRPEDFTELTTITAPRYRARAPRPSAALSVASHLLVDAAATPPRRGGEYYARVQCIHTLIDRSYSFLESGSGQSLSVTNTRPLAPTAVRPSSPRIRPRKSTICPGRSFGISINSMPNQGSGATSQYTLIAPLTSVSVFISSA